MSLQNVQLPSADLKSQSADRSVDSCAGPANFWAALFQNPWSGEEKKHQNHATSMIEEMLPNFQSSLNQQWPENFRRIEWEFCNFCRLNLQIYRGVKSNEPLLQKNSEENFCIQTSKEIQNKKDGETLALDLSLTRGSCAMVHRTLL